jgi:nitrilase
MQHTSFKASVIQTASVAFDPWKTIDRLKEYTHRAASEGAKLVVFPEAFVGGHAKGLGFGSVMGSCTPAGREAFQMYYDGAIDVPGEATHRIGQAALENDVYLVTGAIERELGTLFCVVLFFGPDGTLLGKHRKLMPTGTERLIWGFGDGSTLPVFDTPLGRIGAVICWENYMPMLRLTMYSKGISLYCVPTADHRETWLPTMRHIAREGRCYVLSACQYGQRSDFPEDYPLDEEVPGDTILARGGSCIIDPLGNVLSAPVFGEDLIHTAQIDLGALTRAKFDLDVAGNSARPDIFNLHVDERPRSLVNSVTAD